MSQLLEGRAAVLSATLSQGTCSVSGASATCSLGTRGPGATVSLSLVIDPQTAGAVSDALSVPGDSLVRSRRRLGRRDLT